MNGLTKYLPWVGIIILMASGWFTVRMQVAQAMSREEAHKTFVTTVEMDKLEARFTKEFDRINNKLDNILMNTGR